MEELKAQIKQMLIQAYDDGVRSATAKMEARILALSERHECETCAAKRQKLQEAGLLKSPLRDVDMGVDRGAWADVPDATKWVDELRGDDEIEEPPDVVEPPIAWKGETEEGRVGLGWDKIEMQEDYPFVIPLYTSPPKREWVDLTDEEITDAYAGGMWILAKYPNKAFARAIEAKLREKNT
jgi:hypothetical protein